MSTEWITDRPPTIEDCVGVDRVPDFDHVWVMYEGKVTTCPFGDVVLGCPWQPLVFQMPEPYVKPKRFEVKHMQDVYPGIAVSGYCVIRGFGGVAADKIPTREAAERIAAIYEEVMP